MIKTLKQTIKNLYYWIKKKLIQFKKWIILIIFGSAILAAPLLPTPTPDIALEKIQDKYEASELKDKYRLEKTAFILDAIDENAIQAEVGNKTLDKFTPELTLRKWDDEVNFKVKYKHSEKEKDQKVDIENEKIKWKGKKTEVHYYDIKKGELLHDKVLEHDVYEVEVILLEKPDTNIVEFDIEIKGLAFYYQPELTQEEIDEGAERPENVISSYAVYHESKQGDYSKMGLKNYRAGKAFHIYRPKIIDSAGTEVWGELNIENNLLTVEIPQEFLDNAVYPVRHAAGLTFGYTSVGSGVMGDIATQSSDASRMNGTTYPLTGGGNVTQMSAGLYADVSAEALDLFFAIYREDSDGADSHDLVASAEVLNQNVGTSATFYSIDFSSELLTADDYVLAAVGNGEDLSVSSNRVRISMDSGGSSRHHMNEASSGAGSYAARKAEDPWGVSDWSGEYLVSIYCTYTAGGAEARRMFLTQ